QLPVGIVFPHVTKQCVAIEFRVEGLAFQCQLTVRITQHNPVPFSLLDKRHFEILCPAVVRVCCIEVAPVFQQPDALTGLNKQGEKQKNNNESSVHHYCVHDKGSA